MQIRKAQECAVDISMITSKRTDMAICPLRWSALAFYVTTSAWLFGGSLLSTGLAGDLSNSAGRQSTSSERVEAASSNSEAPTAEMMRGLAREISAGNQAALTRLETIKVELYRDINHDLEKARSLSNLVLMRAAFDQLGKDAGAGNENAFRALKQALGTEALQSFVSDSLGIAASAGHTEALEILLNYKKWGMLRSSVVFAIAKPASKNNERAVAFLADVLNDPTARSLFDAASRGLVGAALAGNERAKAALETYAARDPK